MGLTEKPFYKYTGITINESWISGEYLICPLTDPETKCVGDNTIERAGLGRDLFYIQIGRGLLGYCLSGSQRPFT